MFGETTISYINIWNHPIETTIYKWLIVWGSRYQCHSNTNINFRSPSLAKEVMATAERANLRVCWRFGSGSPAHRNPLGRVPFARTWRVIWPYHPVITTFSAGGKCNNYSDNFAILEDLSEHIQDELPEVLDENRDLIIFHKTLPLAIYHSNQTVRWKFANHIDRLFQERPLPQLFQTIRAAQRGLPAVPESVTQRITTALEFAYQVAQGKSPPVSDSNLKKDCGHRIPYIVYSTCRLGFG